ncbi:MAG: transglycosylase SLT domain-containing protein [Cystobacterineae bacterium]|nr:transglycosylase SLT domain-containing protein [Cystobacterineae bacterium]
MSTWLGIFLYMLALPPAAHAQPASLLEALRTQQPDKMQRAKQTLAECKKTTCPQLAKLQLLLGVLHLSQGEIPQALEYLKATTPSPPSPPLLSAELLPFAHWYLAEAYAYAGELPAALLFLKKAQNGAPAWLLAKTNLRMAELQFLRGQYAKALETLAKENNQSPEALFLLSLNYLGMKQQDKALKPLGQLAVYFPNHPHGLWAEEVFNQLPLSRLPAFGRSPKELLLRAKNLIEGGSPQSALAELEKWPHKLSPKEKAEAAFWRARAYFALGKTELAKEHIKRALQGAPKVAQQASWLMARRHMRSQENALARQWLAKAASQGGGKLAEEARFMSAWLWLNESKWKEAETALGAFADKSPHSSFAVDARWFQGWAQFRQGHCERATQTWQGAALRYANSSMLPQLQYWAARCAPQSNEAEKAALHQAFESLANRFPHSLYGRMAKERLQSTEALFPLVAQTTMPPKMPAELSLAQTLAQAGLLVDAQNEVEALKKRTRGSEAALRLGAPLQSLGAYEAAYALAARHLWGAAFSRKEAPALALLFPRAFSNEVFAASQMHKLPPALIWAVMRRESAFSTTALSHANARGLMQIIPPTGRHIAKHLNMKLSTPDELFSPALNIFFGSWYLQKLVERFGHWAPAIAAYNAGPKAVAKWLEARGQLPLDEWIEEIPFRETRNYIKQVLPDVYALSEMYAELDNSPPPPWSWTLPKPQSEGVEF